MVKPGSVPRRITSVPSVGISDIQFRDTYSRYHERPGNPPI